MLGVETSIPCDLDNDILHRILANIEARKPLPAYEPQTGKRKVCADCKRAKNPCEFYRDRGKRKPICKACWKLRYRTRTRRKSRNPYDTRHYV
jgi:hypothetical protein